MQSTIDPPGFFESQRTKAASTHAETARLELVDAMQGMDGRRAAVAECVWRWCQKWYSPDGRWIAESTAPDTRKTLWLCFGLLAGAEGAVDLANAILGRTEFNPPAGSPPPQTDRAPFGIFVTNHAVQMLVIHSERLCGPVREKLEYWARAALADFPGDRQADVQFHGFNDNMPAKATLGLILGGEYFRDKEAVEHGLWNLRQLRDLLARRGLISEYTSPTYSPLTIVNLTEVALHAKEAEARRLAALCTERVWADVLGHFHPETGTMGGPYSRAYQLDSTGHFSTMACLLWLLFGGQVAFDPIEEINREPMRLVHHHGDRATQLGLLAWVASCPHSPPKYLLRWLESRQYPFSLKASAERGGQWCSEISTTFHAENDFALGSAIGESWSEFAETFFLQYRRRNPYHGVTDLRTVYARMLVDGQWPGEPKNYHFCRSNGRAHTLQKGRMAMVLSRPIPQLAQRSVSSLKFSAILPVHFWDLDWIQSDDLYVYVQDGPIFLAFRGLNSVNQGREVAFRLEKKEGYQLISFYNYEGAPRIFSEEELGRTLNGFLLLVGLRKQESFDQFRDRVRSSELLDYYASEMRTITWQTTEGRLSMSYNPVIDRVRFAAIDGRIAPSPVWQADGLPEDLLPFLGRRSESLNSLDIPYKHMSIAESPHSTWVIHSRGHSRAELDPSNSGAPQNASELA